MPKKIKRSKAKISKSDKTGALKNKNKNKNIINININSNNKKKSGGGGKGKAVQSSGNPIIIHHVPSNNGYMDNEHGIGMTNKINALHGSVSNLKTQNQNMIQNANNQKLEQQKFMHDVTPLSKPVTVLLLFNE